MKSSARNCSFVKVKKVFKIGGISETNAVNARDNEYGGKSIEDNIKSFMDQFKNPKKSENDSAPANPDTPSA